MNNATNIDETRSIIITIDYRLSIYDDTVYANDGHEMIPVWSASDCKKESETCLTRTARAFYEKNND